MLYFFRLEQKWLTYHCLMVIFTFNTDLPNTGPDCQSILLSIIIKNLHLLHCQSNELFQSLCYWNLYLFFSLEIIKQKGRYATELFISACVRISELSIFQTLGYCHPAFLCRLEWSIPRSVEIYGLHSTGWRQGGKCLVFHDLNWFQKCTWDGDSIHAMGVKK